MDRSNPFRVQAFRNLFAAQVIALVGTGLSTVAMTLLAYDLSGGNAAAVLGTALAIKMVAYVVFAPIVGGLAHRFPRKRFLIGMDLIRAVVVVTMPFATATWHLYLLIFLLSLFSAGFKPVYTGTIPDILSDDGQYTKALSMSRLAYDLENVLSPTFAALALLYVSFTGLFVTNSVAFLFSALLISVTNLPPISSVSRTGTFIDEIGFGIRSYLKTPRLRGVLALYMGVAAASAMVIVNTVVYIRDQLGGSESKVAIALAAVGFGSMLAAVALPSVLNRISDRSVMLCGSVTLSLGLVLMSTRPSFNAVLPIWFVIGLGWSLVQTPVGRVVNRSSLPSDRPSYFSAQFALSHACWLVFYPLAGQLCTHFGISLTALSFAVVAFVFTAIAFRLWSGTDPTTIVHSHGKLVHEHLHTHDSHHDHDHEGWEGEQPHSHRHRHRSIRHAHSFTIDDHHSEWPIR